MKPRHKASCPECGVNAASQCVAPGGRKIGKHDVRRRVEKMNRKRLG